MATVDLDWSALDESLANTLVVLLNKHLATATRPSFLGPISVLGFEFGTSSPEIEVIDIQDIYPDFLLEDEDEPIRERSVPPVEDGVKHGHMGYDPGWSPPLAGLERSNSSELEEFTFGSHQPWGSPEQARSGGPFMSPDMGTLHPGHEPPSVTPNPVPISKHPDLQLHLHVTHHSNLRVALSTSLLINYPSPLFMSLPVKLSIVGIVFSAEFVVAYEGSRRRVHLCILDDLDPASAPLLSRKSSDTGEHLHPPPTDASAKIPIGQRLLPNIFIESEIGQSDKHVLKNVSKVERFIQDVVRKVLEDELVYPNFQTIVLGDPSS